ncbi:uncharacterized protein [Argopecten irradians]|uniref:uncharacterized protein n=1 Tax=Argopecten irradians TaxID=31199 RepID=UPI003722B457
MADGVKTVTCECGADNIGLFCNDCECFSCPNCLVDNHKKHDFAKIDDVGKSKRTQLNEIIAEGKESLVSLLQSNLTFIQENIQLETKNHDVVLGQISNRASFLQKEVEGIKENYAEILRDFSEGRHRYLNDFQTLLSDVLCSVQGYPTDPENDPDQSEAKHIQVIVTEMKLQKALSMIAKVSTWPTTPCVELAYAETGHSSEEDFSTLQTLFGSIRQKLSYGMTVDCLTEVVNNNAISFPATITDINSTGVVSVLDVEDAVCIDEMFHISCSEDIFVKSGKSFYKTNANKCKLFMSDVKDVAITTDGTALVIKNDDTCVHQVLPNGASRVFANMCPCQPHYVFLSDTCNVLVVMQEEGHHPVTLAEFNRYGMKVNDQRLDDIDLSFVRFRKDIFGNLYYIKMSYFPLMESVHVLSEAKSDQECYLISGIFGYDPSAACRPIDACFDGEGRVIVADHKNNSIYLQDKEGKLVQMLVAPQQHLLTSPRSVLLVRGQLWVACDDRKIYIFDYKQLITEKKGDEDGTKIL